MSRALPKAYAWLPDVEGLPRMVQEGLKTFGEQEAPGKADNPTIMAWARETGLQKVYTADAVAWCGLWMAVVAKRAGKPVVEGPLWALNWRKFGELAPDPMLGDILVFKRPGGGHVGLYVGEDATSYRVLGGNTKDSVSVGRLAKSRLVAARRPKYRIQPIGVRRMVLNAAGELSENEA